VNEELSNRLVAPFQSLKGVDEIGGVLGDLRGAYHAIRVLTEAVHPVEIRFAIAWGDVDIVGADDDVTEMDGAAFHDADDALARLRDRNRYISVVVDRPEQDWLVRLLSNQFELLLILKHELTERQMEILRAYREARRLSPVAGEYGVTVQSISTTLKRAMAQPMLDIEAELEVAEERFAESML
jgi:predicted DNA-binding protein YlxM (UPF0122 family)